MNSKSQRTNPHSGYRRRSRGSELSVRVEKQCRRTVVVWINCVDIRVPYYAAIELVELLSPIIGDLWLL